MTSQIEKTLNNIWKEKEETIPNIRSIKSVKRLKSPKKFQEPKKSMNDLKIEDVFLNSEYFKHQTGNISSLSFCSGDNAENHWTINAKSEIPFRHKMAKKIQSYPSEGIKSDTAVTDKTKVVKTLRQKLKPQNCPSKETPQNNNTKESPQNNHPKENPQNSNHKENSQNLQAKENSTNFHHKENSQNGHPKENPHKFLEGILSGKTRLDRDLITLITEQMYLAEKELEVTRTHLMETISKLNERDLEILQLHEKIQNLQSTKKCEASRKQTENSTKSTEDYQRLIMASDKLKKQVKDMEEFLNDYGLVWVGDKEINSKPDFDKILKNFQRLNAVASEPRIIQTTMGARFEVPHEISVVLYSNGFLLRNTIFREYEDRSAMVFLKDVEDGYFPSELQAEFPEGVPFEVIDKRNEVYNINSKTQVFQGHGNRLGSTNEGKPSPVVFLEPLKKMKNQESRSSFESSETTIVKKLHKKRSRNVFSQEDRNFIGLYLDASSHRTRAETPEKEIPQQRGPLINVKIRFGVENTESFFLQVPEQEKMFSFQLALQEKLCERYHDECLVNSDVNTKTTDFEIHVYGRNPIRLSDNLNNYPADCGIVNNCVVNVFEI